MPGEAAGDELLNVPHLDLTPDLGTALTPLHKAGREFADDNN